MLVLADGSVFSGRSFGADAPYPEELRTGDIRAKSVGEVVFNTGMSGYHEILTDPSYTGQIVTMTYPLIGNYGDDDEWSEIGPEQVGRSGIKAAGFVVRRLYEGPVGNGRASLHQFLAKHDTPGISEVDTRGLTLKIRDEGSPNGIIVRPRNGPSLSEEELSRCLEYLSDFPPMEGRNLVDEVGSSSRIDLRAEGTPHFGLIDCGIKANIIRELVKRGCGVSLLPNNADEEMLKSVDAVLYSNGPGDPAVLGAIVEKISTLVGTMPVLGICLGHQLIGQALGAKTQKMKFGHHGVNHPVRDEYTKKVFVTSQNHGFDVVEKSLPSELDVWFRNANDGSIEGLRHRELPILTVQFHPEAAPGPRDSSWIFDRFVETARDAAKR